MYNVVRLGYFGLVIIMQENLITEWKLYHVFAH